MTLEQGCGAPSLSRRAVLTAGLGLVVSACTPPPAPVSSPTPGRTGHGSVLEDKPMLEPGSMRRAMAAFRQQHPSAQVVGVMVQSGWVVLTLTDGEARWSRVDNERIDFRRTPAPSPRPVGGKVFDPLMLDIDLPDLVERAGFPRGADGTFFADSVTYGLLGGSVRVAGRLVHLDEAFRPRPQLDLATLAGVQAALDEVRAKAQPTAYSTVELRRRNGAMEAIFRMTNNVRVTGMDSADIQVRRSAQEVETLWASASRLRSAPIDDLDLGILFRAVDQFRAQDPTGEWEASVGVHGDGKTGPLYSVHDGGRHTQVRLDRHGNAYAG